MVDDRRPTNCVNCKTVTSFIENIILHYFKIPFTFSSVKKRVIGIGFITRPKYSIVCTGSLVEFFKFTINIKCWRRKIRVSLATRSLSIDWDINNMEDQNLSRKIKILIFRKRKRDIGTFKILIKARGAGRRLKHRHRHSQRFPSHKKPH